MVASVAKVASPAAAMRYMENDGYYAEGSMEHRQASMWYGEGAKVLGLKGHVTPDKFLSVLEGHVPGRDRPLGKTVNGQHIHKPGTDLTFSAPKSVSVAALVGGDRRLIEAHREAVRDAMRHVEGHILETRMKNRQTGRMEHVKVRNMVAAIFMHDTSRNLDPQLHSHAIVANAALCDDGKWRTVENNSLWRGVMLAGAVYHSSLAARCEALGHTIEKAGRNGLFELKGVYSKDQLDGFSTRSQDMKAWMRDQGLAGTAANAQQAALATRRQKQKHIDREALRENWRERAAELGINLGDMVHHGGTGDGKAPDKASEEQRQASPARLGASATIEWAIRHLEERNSTFAHNTLLAAALSHAPGAHAPDALNRAIADKTAAGRLFEADTARRETGFTTDRLLEAERQNIAGWERAQGQSAPLLAGKVIDRHLGRTELTDGQQAAVRTILESRDRIVGVQGYAGSGKTTMLAAMREMAEGAAKRHRLVGLAPSASAARTLEAESGIESHTLQHFLAKYGAVAEGRADRKTVAGAKAEMKGAVIVVDEASLAGTMQMRGLMRITEALTPSRLVLVGDTKQLDAVDAGVPFRQLQNAGMETAVMDQIMRQRDPELRAAVLDQLEGSPDKALERLGSDVLEVRRDRLAETAARRWLMMDAETRENTGLMAPTHALREDINEHIRADLKRDGLIGGEEADVTRLDPNRLTTAEKELAGNYQTGEVVIFERDLRAAGIEAGEHYSVAGREDGQVILADMDGRQYGFDPAGGIADRLETYMPAEMTLQAGDRIRWTRNDREHGLVNTHRAEITGVSDGMVSLTTEDGRGMSLPVDAPQFQHSDYAFNATVHAFQGRTVDNVIAILDATHAELTNEKTFYVEVSRARDRAVIITDDRKQLAETLLQNSGEALSALQGIGDEPVSERGLQTEAQLADAISVARDEGATSLEEMEREWEQIPAAMDEREYGFDDASAEPDMADDRDAPKAKDRQMDMGFEM